MITETQLKSTRNKKKGENLSLPDRDYTRKEAVPLLWTSSVAGAASIMSTPEPLLASSRSSEKMSLSALQSKMKCDPEGYESELVLIYNQFNSSLELFQQQAALNFTSIIGIGLSIYFV